MFECGDVKFILLEGVDDDDDDVCCICDGGGVNVLHPPCGETISKPLANCCNFAKLQLCGRFESGDDVGIGVDECGERLLACA